MRRKVFPCTEISLVDRRDLGTREILDSYECNLFNTFPLSGKSVPYEQNKIQLASRNVFSLTGITFSHMNRPLELGEFVTLSLGHTTVTTI